MASMTGTGRSIRIVDGVSEPDDLCAGGFTARGVSEVRCDGALRKVDLDGNGAGVLRIPLNGMAAATRIDRAVFL